MHIFMRYLNPIGYFVWRSNLCLKINWLFIRSHHDHLNWSSFVCMSSSSCHPSAHLILAHLQQLNSQQSPSRLNQLYYQLHPTQLNYRLASLAISDQGPALSLSTQRASASRRRSAQPSPTFLHDSNFTIITVLESRWKYWLACEYSFAGKCLGHPPLQQ